MRNSFLDNRTVKIFKVFFLNYSLSASAHSSKTPVLVLLEAGCVREASQPHQERGFWYLQSQMCRGRGAGHRQPLPLGPLLARPSAPWCRRRAGGLPGTQPEETRVRGFCALPTFRQRRQMSRCLTANCKAINNIL